MGRLTLNVLLSFAQYEREVTGERIRDKIAASKEKGMWMGGAPPLGYDPDGRTLKVNPAEAEIVSTIFKLYIKLGCVRLLMDALDKKAIRSKAWVSKKGRQIGGAVFTRGALYKILKNPIYIGHIKHKDRLHIGQHDAIIEEAFWNKVQANLKQGTVSTKSKAKSGSLLAGLLFDENGNGFTPTYASKKGRRYRYYVNQAILQNRKGDAGNIHRLSAPKVEEHIEAWFTSLLSDQRKLSEMVLQHKPSTSTHTLSHCLQKANRLAEDWQTVPPSQKQQQLTGLLNRVTITSDQMMLEYDEAALLVMIGATAQEASDKKLKTDSIPVQFKRRSQESKLIIPVQEKVTSKDPALIKALVRAHGWLDLIKKGKASSLTEVARLEGLQRRYVEKHIEMALLSPATQRAILEGTFTDNTSLSMMISRPK